MMPRVMNKSIWPFQVEIPFTGNEQSDAMYKWCEEKLYHGGHYEPNWYLCGNTFCFKDEKEFLMFCLKWK